MDDYWRDFVQESEEHITELNNSLLALERSPANDDAMEAIFRTAHTLKGNCGAMGLTRASDLAHAIEDLLEAVRSNEVDVTSDLMDTVFDGVDELEAMIDEVATHGEIRTDPAPTIDALRTPLDDRDRDRQREYGSISPPTDDEIDATLARFDPPADDEHEAYLVRISINEVEGVNNGVLVVDALIDAFDLIGTDPSREAIENGSYGGSFDAVFGSAVGEAAITAALEPVDAVSSFEIVSVTERFETLDDSTGADDGADGTTGDDGETSVDDDDLSPDRAQDLSVDELLDEFTEFDDLDAMVEEVDDVSAFDEMGEAGSFHDLLEDDVDIDATADPSDGDAADDAASSDVDATADDESTASDRASDIGTDDDDTADTADTGDDEVDDAGAVFNELKQEVEMVGFDELQNELDELEFDEFDSDDEVDMDELLGDDVDVADNSFLDVTEGELEDEVDAMLAGVDDGSDELEDVEADTDTAADAAAELDTELAGESGSETGGEVGVDGEARANVDTGVDRSDDTDTDTDTDSGIDTGIDDIVADDDTFEAFSFDDAETTDDEPPVDHADETLTDDLSALDSVDFGDLDETAVDDGTADETETSADESTASDDTDAADDGADALESETDVDETVVGGDSGLETETETEFESEADSETALDESNVDAVADDVTDISTDDGDSVATADPSTDNPSTDESLEDETVSDDDTVDVGETDAVVDTATDEDDEVIGSPPESETESGFGLEAEAEAEAQADEESETPSEFESESEPQTDPESGSQPTPDEMAGFGESDDFDDFGVSAEYDDFGTETVDDGFDTDIDDVDAYDDFDYDQESSGGDFTTPTTEFDPVAGESTEDDTLDAGASFGEFDDVDADSATAGSADSVGDGAEAETGTGTGVEAEMEAETEIGGLNGMEIPDITIPEPQDRPRTDEESDEIQSVRVNVDQIDSLLNLVEGLVTSRVRLRHAIESGEDLQTIDKELDDLEDLTAELQETVMDVRLVPLQTVANRLPRVVRDIAREQDKEVVFERTGDDVELDRSILDRIGDPLTHLVRNAVDHGIEPPAEREAAEKPREGTVELRTTQSRDRVTIEIEDDGSGLDPDKLRSAAVDADVLTEDEADELDDDDALELVFHPGLSTAEEVTDVSGRGVGMDVVKRTVDALDGSVSVESEPGEGTTVTMGLPVTVAIADVLFVESGGEEFGIPTKVVQDIEDAHAVETVDGQQVLVDEGTDDELPVIDLADTLETPGASANGDGLIVRIRDDVRPLGVHCSEVRGQQEVVIKPFEGFMSDIPGLSGATVRGRGEVVNILDVNTL